MSLPYKKVLIVGATSGIGLAYAEKVVEAGKFVIVTGRRQSNLDSFVQKHGPDRAEAIQFDITNLPSIPSFAADITKRHPDLDCVILNSGIQRPFNFREPETVDLDLLETELTTNYLSYIHLTKAFLPHLQTLSERGTETALIYMSSGLALCPIAERPDYCASKAALHHFILSLRAQLSSPSPRASGPSASKNISPSPNPKIIEILPPAVQTELHDSKNQPDIKNGEKMGMPLEEFVDLSWGRLCKGEEQIPVGPMVEGWWRDFEERRQTGMRGLMEFERRAHGGE